MREAMQQEEEAVSAAYAIATHLRGVEVLVNSILVEEGRNDFTARHAAMALAVVEPSLVSEDVCKRLTNALASHPVNEVRQDVAFVLGEWAVGFLSPQTHTTVSSQTPVYALITATDPEVELDADVRSVALRSLGPIIPSRTRVT
mmetsp:Transcript_27732/g.60152  ORF Transcript_27732/g.60152 Transcript_27732/m.60152 type:complete len:145 (+) Transcript_27732:226-660(+)